MCFLVLTFPQLTLADYWCSVWHFKYTEIGEPNQTQKDVTDFPIAPDYNEISNSLTAPQAQHDDDDGGGCCWRFLLHI